MSRFRQKNPVFFAQKVSKSRLCRIKIWQPFAAAQPAWILFCYVFSTARKNIFNFESPTKIHIIFQVTTWLFLFNTRYFWFSAIFAGIWLKYSEGLGGIFVATPWSQGLQRKRDNICVGTRYLPKKKAYALNKWKHQIMHYQFKVYK